MSIIKSLDLLSIKTITATKNVQIKIFSPPNGHPTITSRFQSASFEELGIIQVETADDANLIVAALLEELEPFYLQYGKEKQYLIWCDEPLWSNMFSVVDKHQKAVMVGNNQITIHAMNCFTGNVFFSNWHFLTKQYHLDEQTIMKLRSICKVDLSENGYRSVCAFMAYRNGGIWEFKHASGIRSLNTIRSRLGLEGAVCGKVDVYGQGWPTNWSPARNKEAQDSTDIFLEKISELTKYRFSICFENTWAPYYVTEKIWHSIAAGCLPIYYAGKAHTIYQEFEQDSFVDYADFEHPSQLFTFIENMPDVEFERRISVCRAVLDAAVVRSESGIIPNNIQIKMFSDRVKQLVKD
jgi:hypothetical protein